MTSKWETVRLGDVFETMTERLGSHTEEPEVFAISKYEGVVFGSDYHERRVASSSLDNYKVVRQGDWAYSTIHIDEGSIARNRLGVDGVVSPMYTIMSWTSESHSPAYFELLLRSDSMLAVYGDFAQGSIDRRKSLPWKTFSQLEVNIPPLAEQRRIVDLIGALDETIEAAEEKKDILERSRPQLLNSVLSGYETVLLQELLAGISAGKSPSAENRPPVDGEYGVLKVGAVNMWGFIATEAKTLEHTSAFSESMKVKTGDLLMTRANTAEKVGAVCLVETGYDHLYLCDKTLRLEYIESVEPRCLAAALNSEQVRSQIQLAGTGTSASMKNISQKSIGKLRVSWPQSEDDQRTIGDLDSALLRSISESADCILSLRNLRSELLTALLSGAHEIPESYDEVMNAI